MSFHSYFGRYIALMRSNTGKTQEKIAECIGISVRHYSDIEAGKVNIKIDLCVTIISVLEISFDDLLMEYNKNNKKAV